MGLGRRVGSFLISFHLYIAFLTVPVRPEFEGEQMTVVHSWRTLDFDYSTTEEREEAIRTEDFIPAPQMVLVDTQLYEYGDTNDERVFVTIPRFDRGVPVTFGYVTDKTNDGNPLIAPYPSWEMQKPGPYCKGLIDPMLEKLWILDSGQGGDEETCPPKLLVYSPETTELLNSYVFPNDQYSSASGFVALTIDKRDNSDNVFVYIADITGYGLIVYDEESNKSWRIDNDHFAPEPAYQRFEIDNESFDLLDGIFGLALGPIDSNDNRKLYLHALTTRRESWVETSVIRNFQLFENNSWASPESFRSSESLRPSQSAAEASDSNGVLFHSLLSKAAIGCWNMNASEEPDLNTIATMNTETLQFPASAKVVKRRRTGVEELWVTTNRYQKRKTGTSTSDEVNFRILNSSTNDLVKGTKCQPQTLGDDKDDEFSNWRGSKNVHRRHRHGY